MPISGASGGRILLLRVRSEEHLLPLLKEIRESLSPFGPFNHIIFFAPAAVKERFFSFHTHLPDEAEVGATLAFERGMFITALAQVKPFKTRSLPCPLLHGQDGNADRPCHIVIFGDDDLFIQIPLKGGNHPFVKSGPSLEKDPVSDAAVFDDPVQIILDDGVTEPGDQVILLGRPSAGDGPGRIR